VFTFLEDGEGVDDVIKSADHVTPQVDDATNDNSSMKHEDDDANRNGEIPSPQPHTAVTTETDTLDNGLVTSSPAKAADDVADLEFRGRPIFTAQVILLQAAGAVYTVVVCLSFRLSPVGVVLKRLNLGSCKQSHM